jgi:hypothetical protein
MEHNMLTLLAEKMFANHNSSHLRQHTVNPSFFLFYRFNKAYYFLIHVLLHHLLFVNSCVLVNSVFVVTSFDTHKHTHTHTHKQTHTHTHLLTYSMEQSPS